MSDPNAKTQRFDDLRWLSPVETAVFLPQGQAEGTLCYVQHESAMYEVRGGVWIKSNWKKPSS